MDQLPQIPQDAVKSIYTEERQPIPESTLEVKDSLAQSFLMMAGGLALTALTSWLTLSSGLLYFLYTHEMMLYGVMIAELAVVFCFSFMMKKASTLALGLMFGAYSILTGISLTSLAVIYSGWTLFITFGITAVYFLCLAIIGYTTKKNLSGIGMACLTGLVVMLISQLIMMIFNFDWSTRLYAIVGMLLFTGITAWDVQRAKVIFANAEQTDMPRSKWVMYFALELYLDFINIFLYVLRLVGAGSSRD